MKCVDRIVLATSNPHKLDELRAIFAGVSPRLASVLVTLDALPDAPFAEPAETGDSFLANATIKASAYARATGLPCIADDSGLCVDALAGKPGVISSHYSTDGVETGLTRAQRDLANNQRLLADLADTPFEHRTARFTCTMVLAWPGAHLVLDNASELSPAAQAPASEQRGSASGGRGPAVGGRVFNPPHTSHFSGHFRAHTGGNLPHWEVGGATYFVTFNLNSGPHIGPLDEAERTIVRDALLHWHQRRLLTHAAVVMPDHVHWLLRPLQRADGLWPTLASILHSVKRHCAASINRRRDTQGPLWQPEYFDRIIRSDDEMDAAHEYIEMNPVRAGLVSKPGEYPFLIRGSHTSQGHSGGLETRPPSIDNRNPAARAQPLTTTGAFEGRIGLHQDHHQARASPHLVVPRGGQGFGYDPLLLLPPDFNNTAAELDPQAKNRRSHRAGAALAMARQMLELAGGE
jgi:non-canonical purine NTP pyrophosphatase (RdgB/HAM1 family)